MTISNSFPGYGAIPLVGACNNVQSIGTIQSALEIRNDHRVISFNTDGTIETDTGTITTEDWITVIKLMKLLIMDMSKDPEIVSKYPYIRDTAHKWLLDELKK